MRTIPIALITALLPLGAQEPPKQIELDYLRTPSSPAFVLLGVSPTSITRPATPRALATELLSSTNRGTVVPNNFAVEFAPYWLTSRPALTYDEYVHGEPKAFRTLSISLATSKADTSADSLAVQMALGVRVQPLAGTVSKKFAQGEQKLERFQRSRTPLIRALADSSDAVEEAEAEVARLDTAGTDEQRQVAGGRLDVARQAAARAQRRLDVQEDSIRLVVQEMGSPDAERMGHFLELASALGVAYPTATFESGKFSRFGLWSTYTYRWESRVDAIALGRVLLDLGGDGTNAADVGGRLHYAHSDLGVSAEWVTRATFDLGDATTVGDATQRTLTLTASNRVVGVVDYRAADGLYVTFSFGQDFKKLGAARHPLVALFGMQLMYGDKPVVQRSGS